MTMNLSGLTVVITRQREQYSASANIYQAAGARPISCPLIQIVFEWDKGAEERILRLPDYDAWIATSANGIRALAQACDELGIQKSKLPRGFVIGESSERAAEEVGLSVTRPPSAKNANQLANWLILDPLEAPKASLFVTSQLAGHIVPDALSKIGSRVDSVVLYKTLPAVVDEECWRNFLVGQDAKFTAIVVYSPSGVRALHERMSSYLEQSTRKALIACIGETTAAWCEEHGVKVDAIASSPTDYGVCEALNEVWQRRHQEP